MDRPATTAMVHDDPKDRMMNRMYLLVAAVAMLAAAGCSGDKLEETGNATYQSLSQEFRPVHEGYGKYSAQHRRDPPYRRIADSVT